MKNCYKFKSLISNYIDKEISFKERKFFESHIEECVECKAMYASISATRNHMQNLPKVTVGDDFMDSLKSKILADRNAKILASQNTGFSWKRVPAFTYALSSLAVVIVAVFTIMKVGGNPTSVQQMPAVAQEKIDDAKNFQQKFNATPSHLKDANLVNIPVDTMFQNDDDAIRDFEQNINKVGYEKK